MAVSWEMYTFATIIKEDERVYMTDIDNYQMLPIGTLLKGGEYRVERYIASGGFGNTYEVEHIRLGKRLAIKEFFMRDKRGG